MLEMVTFDTRRTPLRLQRLPEKEFGSHYIATRTQSEIHRLALPVHGAVRKRPDATDLDIGLVNTLGLADKPVPAALEFRRKTLYPAHNRRMGPGQTTFSHHLHQIQEAQLGAKIPADK
jgi:hypothetical protein